MLCNPVFRMKVEIPECGGRFLTVMGYFGSEIGDSLSNRVSGSRSKRNRLAWIMVGLMGMV